MGLFDRFKGGASRPDPEPEVDGVDDAMPELPLRPRVSALSEEDRAHIAETVAQLEGEGVDLSDLASISGLYERELSAWEAIPAKKRPDHTPIVARVAIAVGEYLVRTTDLSWCEVLDAFGSAIAVAHHGDDFIVVPRDLVGVRWLSRRHDWVDGVVSHLVWVRADQAR